MIHTMVLQLILLTEHNLLLLLSVQSLQNDWNAIHRSVRVARSLINNTRGNLRKHRTKKISRAYNHFITYEMMKHGK